MSALFGIKTKRLLVILVRGRRGCVSEFNDFWWLIFTCY
jgi:hypothetical protein